jgi:hypothetical protein
MSFWARFTLQQYGYGLSNFQTHPSQKSVKIGQADIGVAVFKVRNGGLGRVTANIVDR